MNDFAEMWRGDWDAVDWSSVTWRVIAVIILWILILVGRRYANRVLRLVLVRNKHISSNDMGVLRRFLGYLFVFVGVIASLALLEMQGLLHSALTAAGVFGIAIGLAVRDVVANFIAGIFIFVDHVFAIGDVVKIGEHIGTVKDVSLRTTTLTALDGPVVTIPNAVLTTAPLVNFSAAPERRIVVTMSIIGEADIGAALSILEEVVRSEERIIHDETPAAYVTAVREYMVDLQITCRVRPNDMAVVNSDLQRRVVEGFRRHGIRLAMPVRLNLSTES